MSDAVAAPDRFSLLLQVQDHDTVIDQLLHRKQTIGARAELSTVESQMRALEARRRQVAEVRDGFGEQQAALEGQITASRTRRADIEKRLYGGQVTAARDLQAMDDEVRHLRQHVSELEDRELEVMVELEPLDADLATIDGELSELADKAAALRVTIAEQESEIDSELEVARRERAEIADKVPEDLLSRYEQLRNRLGGTGAARLVSGSCGGCHLQLPAMELDRVKKAGPDEIIYCDQCGRILVR